MSLSIVSPCSITAPRSPRDAAPKVQADQAVIEAYLGVAHSEDPAEPHDARDFDYLFFIEVLVGGLLSGVMYSLVAIGFVLIYKTSGVLNFAQGPLLLFAALTFVCLVERGVPSFAALFVVLVVMTLIGMAIERAVLRPLANRPPITLFMATLGLAYVIEGAAQLLWGTQVHALDSASRHAARNLWRPRHKFDLFAARLAATDGRGADRSSFDSPAIGLAFRAVAADQFAAPTVGLRLPRIWATGLDRRRLRRRWSPACCGARGSACNSRFRWSF